jgi:hypothetical protein
MHASYILENSGGEVVVAELIRYDRASHTFVLPFFSKVSSSFTSHASYAIVEICSLTTSPFDQGSHFIIDYHFLLKW